MKIVCISFFNKLTYILIIIYGFKVNIWVTYELLIIDLSCIRVVLTWYDDVTINRYCVRIIVYLRFKLDFITDCKKHRLSIT